MRRRARAASPSTSPPRTARATQRRHDYVAASLTGQTIPAGSTIYIFNVTVNGDVTAEADETFFVNVTNVVNATAGDAQGLGTIVNDDCRSRRSTTSRAPARSRRSSAASSPRAASSRA